MATTKKRPVKKLKAQTVVEVPSEKEPVKSQQEIDNDEIVNETLALFDYYKQSRQGRLSRWTKIWQNYVSILQEVDSPYVSNLFIPKTHEAVELLAAFLSGPNQSINAEAEGKEDTKKAVIVAKWLDFMWRKTVKARNKVIVWIKQAILFGNGILHIYWDADDGHVEMEVRDIRDVFFDYFVSDLQESESVILRIYKNIKEVKNDERYDEKIGDTYVRDLIVPESNVPEDKDSKFSSYDGTVEAVPPQGVCTLLERYTDEKIITIGSTSAGWKILRKVDNPNKRRKTEEAYKPFVKVRLKNNPLPNRAYDTGAVEPTLYLQDTYNELIAEFLDNVKLVNQKGWIKRRGAAINPMDLIRRPGFIIDVDNINEDLKSEETSDIKQSIIEALKIVDNEFQQASMVVNLLKGIPGADTATEAQLGQENVQSLLGVVDGNIKEALSEAGQMVLDIAFENINDDQTVKLFDDNEKVAIAEFNPSEIDGFYDIKISADRPSPMGKFAEQKQMESFAALVLKDANTLAKYPDLPVKIYKRWLEKGGEGDIDFFFETANAAPVPPAAQPGSVGPTAPSGATATPLAPTAPAPSMPAPMQ